MGVESEAMMSLIQQLANQLAKPYERPIDHQDAIPGDTPTEAAIDASVAALKQAATELQRQAPPPPPPVGPEQIVHPKAGATSAATTASPAEVGPSPYARLAVIAEAVAADRIDLLLDPILGLEDRKARHFEVSVRLRSPDGEMLSPDDYRSMLAGTGLLGRIDAAKLTRSAAIADRLTTRGNAAALFANVQGESLSDNGFLDVFADTFIDRQPVSSRLVLSFSQADVRSFGDVHWEAVTTMSELGFRFALEHITDLDMDFEMLKDNGFAFVKLDASVFLHGMRSGDNLVPSADICRHMAGLGFGLIVGGIVDESELARIMGFGVVFGQGALFGRPHAVKVETRQRAAA